MGVDNVAPSLTSGRRRRPGSPQPSPSGPRTGRCRGRSACSGVDDPVVVEACGHEEGVRLSLDLLLDGSAAGLVLGDVEVAAGRLGRLAPHDREHPGQLLGPHHRELRVDPGEEQPRVQGSPGHAVVAGTERGADVDREVGNGAVRDGVDHLGAVLDDPALLVGLADHVAGRVLQEDEGGVPLVGQQDELGGLAGLLAEEDPSGVDQEAHRVPVHRGPARDEAAPVEALVLAEARAVDDPCQHLVGVDRDPEVRRGDTEQLVGVVRGVVGRQGRSGPELAPPQLAHDLATQPDAVELVGGEVVRKSRDPGVHLGAPQLLVVGVLAGRHLDEGGPSEEDLGLAVDQDGIVAHPWHIGAAGRGVAEDEGDGRDPHGRELGEVVKDPAGEDKDLGLGGQVGPAGLDQVHHGQAVGAGDLERTESLAQGVRVDRAAANGRIVTDHHALDARDDADAGHDAGTDAEFGAPGGEGRKLEEGRVPVDEQLEPLPHQELPPPTMALRVAWTAARPDQVELLLQRLQRLQLCRPVLPVGLAAHVERRREDRGRFQVSGHVRLTIPRAGPRHAVEVTQE